SAPKVVGRAIVTGKHAYSSDIRRPGMRVGKILRPPAFNAKLLSVDTHAAEAIPDVTVVHEDTFVGVTAPNEQIAAKALAALRPEWQTTPQPSSAELFNLLKKPATEERNGGGPPQSQGSVA